MTGTRQAASLWVVVPVFNERRMIASCLESLSRQTDSDFRVAIVDNNSTDDSAEAVGSWLRAHPSLDAIIVTESRKGTGAAADTGFRHAIAEGAEWVARTDADCVVAPDWVEAIRRRTNEADMLGGKTRVRLDDSAPKPFERLYLPATIALARAFGKVRPSNRGPEYQCPYVMCVGNNLAVRSTKYLESGGFPRLAIEELPIPNDRALVNRVRTVSSRVRYVPDMVVYNSARRLRAYGLRRTLRWYADHSLDTGQFEVDVR
jgi:glycosyltransferase involved in cell wall biosynthesis